MKKILVEAGPYRFVGQLEEEKAPRTCQRFLELLPFKNKVIHSRWSGEAVWIPLGDFDTGLTFWGRRCECRRLAHHDHTGRCVRVAYGLRCRRCGVRDHSRTDMAFLPTHGGRA